MPRIPPWLFRRARHHSPHVATLLPACKDIPSALNELRWIREHVQETHKRLHEHHVAKLCGRRGRGEPLQYVLGSQPFGSLDIKCRPGVLIPRSETEAYTSHLAQLIKFGTLLGARAERQTKELKVIDFCTGTGCIPLFLFATLRKAFPRLTVRGIDVSPNAIALAKYNIDHNLKAGNIPGADDSRALSIVQADLFNDEAIADQAGSQWDVLVSNPPYVSKDTWNNGRGQLGYSVRKYEPRLALVPGEQYEVPAGMRHEDIFYARLLDVAQRLQSKLLLMEIGDEDQALRVAGLFYAHALANGGTVELWRDWPDLEPAVDEPISVSVAQGSGRQITLPIKGSGNLRSLFIQTAYC